MGNPFGGINAQSGQIETLLGGGRRTRFPRLRRAFGAGLSGFGGRQPVQPPTPAESEPVRAYGPHDPRAGGYGKGGRY